MLGLYLHIPFCSAICNYCNFNRGLFEADRKRAYVRALLTEIRAAGGDHPAADGVAADTVYFGGGTPSLLEPDEVAQLVDACRASFSVAQHAEVTLEANPDSVSAERLSSYRRAGVNRLSFGVQSFSDEELRRLSRLHSAERAGEAVSEARTAGFDNVSLDLMMWLPGQSTAQWLRSVERAISLAPDHLSLYMLEVYPNAPLRDEMAREHLTQAADDDVACMYEKAMERLESHGLEQYEISNVAKPGRRSRHNLKYWTDGEWLGFGCGAHSTYANYRWRNLSSIDDYIGRLNREESPRTDVRRLERAEQLSDALFLGLRLTDGLDCAAVSARYGVDVWARYREALQPFINEGLIVMSSGRLRLTRRGMLLAHEVMAVFV
jgi:oxygen-independent coproporphyrinogen-3 oxidase